MVSTVAQETVTRESRTDKGDAGAGDGRDGDMEALSNPPPGGDKLLSDAPEPAQ